MATTINADKTIGSVIVTADTSGILSLQAAGVTLLTLDSADITVANKPVTFGGDVTISGLTYPASDGQQGQAIVTDGAGNLSFANAGASKNFVYFLSGR